MPGPVPVPRMHHTVAIATVTLTALLAGCAVPGRPAARRARQSRRFIGLTDFSNFQLSRDQASGAATLTSPEIDPRLGWTELVVSWNMRAADAGLRVEVRAIYPDHRTRYYILGRWSADPTRHPRESVNGQRDADGEVKTDTLVLTGPGARIQARLSFTGHTAAARSALKFLGLSFCDSRASEPARPPNRLAWGKSLPVPERSQLDYSRGRDWCSPTSVSMLLAYWAKVLHRPDLERDVPEVAAGVNDPNWPGTGNWPFNTAYAGGFKGMRAYVTRLGDVSELEDWIAAGVPVSVSVSPGVLNGRPDLPDTGHLVVCVGFTPDGNPIINDPWARRSQGQPVRRVDQRQNLAAAWRRSHRTAYLIYPTDWPIPGNRRGHWEGPDPTR
ncbi:MAG: peptidase C39 family protein [Verrucomicrobia bacterium]|nr:peptidase C39 family protein [Verrucomicrobiota bacterium]